MTAETCNLCSVFWTLCAKYQSKLVHILSRHSISGGDFICGISQSCVDLKFAVSAGKRQHWTDEQRAAIDKHLSRYVCECHVPGKEIIVNCIDAEPVLGDRNNWRRVKDLLNAQVQKRRRLIAATS